MQSLRRFKRFVISPGDARFFGNHSKGDRQVKISEKEHLIAQQSLLSAEIIALYGAELSLTAIHRVQDDYQAVFLADNYGLADRPPRYYPFSEVSPVNAARRLRLLRVLPYIERGDVIDYLKAQGAEDHGARAMFEAGENEIQRHWMFMPGSASSVERLRALNAYRDEKLISTLIEADAISAYISRQADNARFLQQVFGQIPEDYEMLYGYSELEKRRHRVVRNALDALDRGDSIAEVSQVLLRDLVLSRVPARHTKIKEEAQ